MATSSSSSSFSAGANANAYEMVHSSGGEESDGAESGPEDAGVLEVKNAPRKGKEAAEREAARDQIAKRSRMWQTVGGSSDEEEEEQEKEDDDRERGAGRKKGGGGGMALRVVCPLPSLTL